MVNVNRSTIKEMLLINLLIPHRETSFRFSAVPAKSMFVYINPNKN